MKYPSYFSVKNNPRKFMLGRGIVEWLQNRMDMCMETMTLVTSKQNGYVYGDYDKEPEKIGGPMWRHFRSDFSGEPFQFFHFLCMDLVEDLHYPVVAHPEEFFFLGISCAIAYMLLLFLSTLPDGTEDCHQTHVDIETLTSVLQMPAPLSPVCSCGFCYRHALQQLLVG